MAYVPIVAVCVTAIGILLALTVAVRNRSLFPPRLVLRMETVGAPRTKLPKRLRNRSVSACFSVLPSNLAQTEAVMLPVQIQNPSARRIGEIMLELNYPAAFLLPNSELQRQLEVAAQANAWSDDEKRHYQKLIEMREVFLLRSMCRVRYNIGALRPGESVGFFEVIRVNDSANSSADPRLADTLAGRVLDDLLARRAFVNGCYVTASVLSDLTKPLRSSLWVFLCRASRERLKDDVLEAYVDAHWLGEDARGRAYFRPRLPFERFYRRQLSEDQVLEFVVAGSTVKPAAEPNRILLELDFSEPDQQGFGMAKVPGYDIFGLPRATAGVDAAFQSIGYVRPPKLLSRRSKPA